mgnify:CR=1 FL=1
MTSSTCYTFDLLLKSNLAFYNCMTMLECFNIWKYSFAISIIWELERPWYLNAY